MAPHATDESHSHTNGNTSAPPNGQGGNNPDPRARRSRTRRSANRPSAFETAYRVIMEEEIRRSSEEREELRREAEEQERRRQIEEQVRERREDRRRFEEREELRREEFRRGAEIRRAERRREEEEHEDVRRYLGEELRQQIEEAGRSGGGSISRSRFRAERLGDSEQRHREPPNSPEEYHTHSRHREPPNGLGGHHTRPHSVWEPGNRLSSTDRGAMVRAMRQEQDRRARLRARYAALPAQALGSSRHRHHEPDAMGIDDPSWIEQRLQERMWRGFPIPPELNRRPRQNGINGINGNQRPRLNGINGINGNQRPRQNGANGINGNQRPRQNGINGINGVNGHSHEGEEASQDEHSDEDDKDASGQPMEQLNINGVHEDLDENDDYEQRDTGEAGHYRI